MKESREKRRKSKEELTRKSRFGGRIEGAVKEEADILRGGSFLGFSRGLRL